MFMRVLPVVEIVTAGHDNSLCGITCQHLRASEDMCTLFGERLDSVRSSGEKFRANTCHNAEDNWDSMDDDTQEWLRQRQSRK